MSKITDRLASFYDAINGVDRPGEDTCDICGRSGVKGWRTSRPTATGIQRATLCGPCLGDELLTSRTGPNDAVQRGLMYVESRRIARDFLKRTEGR